VASEETLALGHEQERQRQGGDKAETRLKQCRDKTEPIPRQDRDKLKTDKADRDQSIWKSIKRSSVAIKLNGIYRQDRDTAEQG
jgi:hypothetical protein